MSRLPPSLQWLLLAAVCLLGVAYWQKHRQWQDARAGQSAQQAALGARLTESGATITQLAGQVDALDTALGEARTKLTAADARYVETARELSTAKARIEELEQATRDLSDLQAAHEALGREVAVLRDAADPALPAAFTRVMKELEGRLIQENTPPVPVPVLATSRARDTRVVSVGPSQAFVVVDYGAEHGALPRQEMLIRRGTETLARVHISDVRPRHSVAQVVPDSVQGALHKGDSAVLTP
ncbi:MAG: hypothetical protein KIT44_12590 [Opitutaceae bacterium]|nr:hypothetical protein [Opitutaceae bacterium]